MDYRSWPAIACHSLSWLARLDDCVHDRQQLVHAGHQSDFGGRALSPEFVVKCLDHWLIAHRTERCHVQRSAYSACPAVSAHLGAHHTAVPTERSHTHELSNFPFAQRAQIWQDSNQHSFCCHAYAFDANEQVKLFFEVLVKTAGDVFV